MKVVHRRFSTTCRSRHLPRTPAPYTDVSANNDNGNGWYWRQRQHESIEQRLSIGDSDQARYNFQTSDLLTGVTHARHHPHTEQDFTETGIWQSYEYDSSKALAYVPNLLCVIFTLCKCFLVFCYCCCYWSYFLLFTAATVAAAATVITFQGGRKVEEKNSRSFPGFSRAINLLFYRLLQQKVNVIMTFIKGQLQQYNSLYCY